jgi:hypothetical protein
MRPYRVSRWLAARFDAFSTRQDSAQRNQRDQGSDPAGDERNTLKLPMWRRQERNAGDDRDWINRDAKRQRKCIADRLGHRSILSVDWACIAR